MEAKDCRWLNQFMSVVHKDNRMWTEQMSGYNDLGNLDEMLDDDDFLCAFVSNDVREAGKRQYHPHWWEDYAVMINREEAVKIVKSVYDWLNANETEGGVK